MFVDVPFISEPVNSWRLEPIIPHRPKTFIQIVLDESGSMGSKRDVTLSGLNEYLDGLRGTPDCFVTLTKFSTYSHSQFVSVPLERMPRLGYGDYAPNGFTALYDAVADSIRTAPLLLPGDRVLCVIITDGEENSSRRTTLNQAQSLIREKNASEQWTFVFLGADADSWNVASSLGVYLGNTYTYTNTIQGNNNLWKGMGIGTRSYCASADTQTSNFMSQSVKDAIDGNDSK